MSLGAAAALMSLVSAGLTGLPATMTDDPSLWVTLEVLNRDAFGGRSILHLEDLVGENKGRDVPGLPKPRVVVFFSTLPAACGPLQAGMCRDVEALRNKLGKEVLIAALIMARPDEVARTRSELARAGYGIVATLDPQGVAARLLHMDRPGVAVVFDAAGHSVTLPPPGDVGDATQRRRWIRALRERVQAALRTDDDGDP
ncbi:MAG: hypothetical protein IPK13_25815 [Deltaproteobacteria bacterium]|nr:hypothetical protein [Deltaproteobacteria bacterium]